MSRLVMRTHGTLARWNEDRGFGFIAPAQGGDELFVHVSAFPRDGQRPRPGELLSFETESGRDGKPKAVRVMRPGQLTSPTPRRRHVRARPNRAKELVGTIFGLLVMGATGAIAYSAYTPSAAEQPPAQAAIRLTPPPASFTCDGRTMCSQMTSCAEARLFLKHCPNTKMDGNRDGEPCEQQWCN